MYINVPKLQFTRKDEEEDEEGEESENDEEEVERKEQQVSEGVGIVRSVRARSARISLHYITLSC